MAEGPDAGLKTITCTDGTSVTVSDGQNGQDANAVTDFTKLTAFELQQEDVSITVNSVSNAPRPVVSFTGRDLKGRGVKNIPPAYFGSIALPQLVPGSTTSGVAPDTWVSHITNCSTCTSSTETANAASLVDNGDGTYTYTFVKDVVNPTRYDGGLAIVGLAFDENAVHRFAMRLDASGNPFRPVDVTFAYVPATGANVDGQNGEHFQLPDVPYPVAGERAQSGWDDTVPRGATLRRALLRGVPQQPTQVLGQQHRRQRGDRRAHHRRQRQHDAPRRAHQHRGAAR